jgi:hypothetical protein
VVAQLIGSPTCLFLPEAREYALPLNVSSMSLRDPVDDRRHPEAEGHDHSSNCNGQRRYAVGHQ